MSTVREMAFELFREHGMTTIFGNPGSTELPMLAEFPDDFRYVLGLQEAVAVGMADGYAQAAGRVTHVNLHTAPGLGNAMGAIFNAQANKSPLLDAAGAGPLGDRSGGGGPGRGPRPGAAPRASLEPRDGRRSRHRRERRLGRCDRARREAAPAGVGNAGAGR